MIGMPKWLNSKEDVLYCVRLAIEGRLDKEIVKKRLQNLLSDEKGYIYKNVVNEGYTPSENEKICEVKKEDGTIEYHAYELQENQNARFLQMGFTKDEITSIINQLEV
jgi:hypothetical protein